LRQDVCHEVGLADGPSLNNPDDWPVPDARARRSMTRTHRF
jgi:hypothetical protein